MPCRQGKLHQLRRTHNKHVPCRQQGKQGNSGLHPYSGLRTGFYPKTRHRQDGGKNGAPKPGGTGLHQHPRHGKPLKPPQPANHRSRCQHQGHPDGQNSGCPPLRHIQAERRRSQGGKHQPAGQASSQGGNIQQAIHGQCLRISQRPKGRSHTPGGGTEQQPYRPRKRTEPCDARRPCGKEGKNRANPPVKRHQEHAAPIPRGNSRQPQRNAGMPEPFCGFHPPAPASRRKGKQDGEGPAVHQHAVECEHEAAGRPRQRLLRHQTGSVRQRPQETQHESPCQPEQGEILARTAEKQKKNGGGTVHHDSGNTLRTLSTPRKEKQQIRAIPPKSRTSGSHAFHADGSSPKPGPNIQHASSREPTAPRRIQRPKRPAGVSTRGTAK